MSLRHTALIFVGMLLPVGLQTGILVFPAFQSLSEFFQINIILIYWAAVAAAFALLTNAIIKKNYEMPMRRLGDATKKVAEGDFSVYAEPIHTQDQYDYIDVMFTDFNKMVAELGSIETLKNDFVSNVSHELKTPLSVIKNYATMLNNENLPKERKKEYINSISEASDRLSALITNILRLSKLENQAIETMRTPYNLCRQLTDCILGFEALWEAKQLEIEVNIEDRATIAADESMMEIVWNNLLANAIKFTDPGGKIALTQKSDCHAVTIAISDSGCGMNNETLKHIFDKFYQGDTSRSGEGNGLGLALAHRIIEKSDGTLSVESEVGTGSIFTVVLPIC